jgi:hypothetical protein
LVDAQYRCLILGATVSHHGDIAPIGDYMGIGYNTILSNSKAAAQRIAGVNNKYRLVSPFGFKSYGIGRESGGE